MPEASRREFLRVSICFSIVEVSTAVPSFSWIASTNSGRLTMAEMMDATRLSIFNCSRLKRKPQLWPVAFTGFLQ